MTLDPYADTARSYQRDGVACVRQMFDAGWVARLAAAAAQVVVDPEAHGGRGYMHGPMTAINFLYRRPGAFRDFVFESNVGEVIGRVVGARSIRMFHDYVFSKQPGCEKVVPWHTDGGGYAMQGEMLPNIWIALTRVTEDNGRLEFVPGVHRERWSATAARPLPDYESLLEAPGSTLRRLAWNLEPGDAVIFHPFTPHHTKANRSAAERTGYAVRVIGEDVVWDRTKSTWLQIPGIDYARVVDGAPVEDEDAFPIMWSDGGDPVRRSPHAASA